MKKKAKSLSNIYLPVNTQLSQIETIDFEATVFSRVSRKVS